jgi:hypothetical protein
VVPAAALAAWALLATTHAGCGESAPPEMTKEQFKEVKQEREKIIQKEYGGSAFQKGAPKTKGTP